MFGLYQYVTFDCYGTLIDWETGIATALLEAAALEGVKLEAQAVLGAFAEIEPVIQRGPFRSYREVLRETTRRLAKRLGWRLAKGDEDLLPRSLPGWSPFEDTTPALARLERAGFKLGILSNVDDDLLEATLARLGVKFELIVTAEQVGSYKPAPAHFLAARKRIGDAGWLHAAQSFFHDVKPARQLEVPVAWINRKGEAAPDETRPDAEFRSLHELADWLG